MQLSGRWPSPLNVVRRTRAPWTAAGWLTLCGAALLPGCQAPVPPAGPASFTLHVADYEEFLDDTLSLLRRHDFPPDFVDRQRGLIVTQPATSGQWFEFWRGDARGGYQLLESSLHTMRRVVTVNIEPESAAGEVAEFTTGAPGGEAPTTRPAGDYRVTVRVDKFRYSAPERQITTASGAMAMYSERIPTSAGLRGARSRGVHWVALGRDGLLEEFLLQQIVPAASGASPTPQPAAAP